MLILLNIICLYRKIIVQTQSSLPKEHMGILRNLDWQVKIEKRKLKSNPKTVFIYNKKLNSINAILS